MINAAIIMAAFFGEWIYLQRIRAMVGTQLRAERKSVGMAIALRK